MSDQYILNDQDVPVPEPDTIKWATWFEDRDKRRVALEEIGESTVSTVFLGIDHNYGGAVPVLWETMVFGGQLDQEQDRCAGGRKEALQMHALMVEKVKNHITAES